MSPLATIDLAPLRQAEAMELAAGFFDAGNRFALDCVERAGGNPLFLDQLLRSAQEAGAAEVPASVQSLVQARVDRLGQADRLALQAASVVGQRFAPDAVKHLINSPHFDFEPLLRSSLIRPEGDAFLFAHALVRDGVYSSLLTARRNELHRLAADWFHKHDPILQAEHLDRAEDTGPPKRICTLRRQSFTNSTSSERRRWQSADWTSLEIWQRVMTLSPPLTPRSRPSPHGRRHRSAAPAPGRARAEWSRPRAECRKGQASLHRALRS